MCVYCPCGWQCLGPGTDRQAADEEEKLLHSLEEAQLQLQGQEKSRYRGVPRSKPGGKQPSRVSQLCNRCPQLALANPVRPGLRSSLPGLPRSPSPRSPLFSPSWPSKSHLGSHTCSPFLPQDLKAAGTYKIPRSPSPNSCTLSSNSDVVGQGLGKIKVE